MSSYCSIAYLCIFLPIVILAYAIIPQRHRWKVLLLASYAFFWSISNKLIVYLLVSTVAVHYIGLWLTLIQNECKQAVSGLDRTEKKAIKAQYLRKQRKVVAFAVIFHIGMLIVLKYTNFFGTNINSLLNALNSPFKLKIPRFLLPIGISFYTLQAVAYTFDVYRGTIKADENIGRLALFMSFFPSLMEGPICRYSQTAVKLYEGEGIKYNNLTFGYQRILYGMIKKVIVADRLNILIGTVFDNYSKYNGGIVALAMVCYTVQLYMEFSGTMDVVIGSAQIFGVTLPENFRQPFFSKTISEFWTRWHITLGTFFRDYLFYPLSMTKPLKNITVRARKHLGNHFGPLIAGAIALFCVWLCNGLWHGAGWQYIFFGMYHFVLILCGNIVEPFVKWYTGKLKINRTCFAYRIWQIARTVVLVNIGEMFFRAKTLGAGMSMFKSMVTDFSFASFKDGSFLRLGMDEKDFYISIITVVLVFVVSIIHEKNISIREKVSKRNIVIRWVAYYAVLMAILIFGAYGIEYKPVEPIYASF